MGKLDLILDAVNVIVSAYTRLRGFGARAGSSDLHGANYVRPTLKSLMGCVCHNVVVFEDLGEKRRHVAAKRLVQGHAWGVTNKPKLKDFESERPR